MPMPFSEAPNWVDLHRARHAIVIVDVVESVRLIQEHGDDVIERWHRFVQEVRNAIVTEHGGRMVKSLGDGMLLIFEGVAPALAAVRAIEQHLVPYNADRAASAKIVLRFGIHTGDVVVDEVDIFGPSVNLAARLAAIAVDGGVILSAEARDQIVPGFDGDVEDLGEHDLRGIAAPVRAFRVGPAPALPQPHWTETLRSRPAVMVAPFESHKDAAEPVLGMLVTDNLIRRLSKQVFWRVISRLSSAPLGRRAGNVFALARATGADYVVSGRCGQLGETLVVTFEVAQVRDGSLVYAGRVQGQALELLAPDDPITGEMLEQVCRSMLAAEAQRAVLTPMPQLHSYSLLFGGIALMHRMARDDFFRAHELLQHLCQRHPRAPEPRAWLAKWHVLSIVQGWSKDLDKSATQGHDLVQRALDHDPEHALALTIDGLIAVLLRDDLKQAEQRYDAALMANPNEPYAHLFRSSLLAYTERGAESVQSAQAALALSPLDPNRYFFESFLSHACLAAGDLAASVATARASLKLNASHFPTWRTLAIAAQLSGDSALARDAVTRLLSLQPDYSIERFRQRYPGRQLPAFAEHVRALAEAGLPA